MLPIHACFAIIAAYISWQVYHSHVNTRTNLGSWGCEMSWMTPSYTLVDIDLASRYRLYLYREQGWDDHAQGQPVLFIPGNAGSYQQVRSIASFAARNRPGRLDFYTIDLNEEFSALHGPVLEIQAEYVHEVIQHLYAVHNRPVTLIGHSMGGIVARLAASKPSVESIITLSTPHTMPPLPLDLVMERLYRRASANPIPFISICGGVSDTQITSDSCAVDNSTLFTTGMTGVWTGVDHQAMVWCHQVRARVVPLLLAEPEHYASKAQHLYLHQNSTILCFDRSRPDDEWESLPWPKTRQPFPLPGQGIAPEEVAWLHQVPPGSHDFKCDGPVLSGSHSSATVSDTWHGPMGLTQSITFARHASSLFAYRIAITSDRCPVPPLIRHRVVCGGIAETHFGFPPFIAHNHLADSPFRAPCRAPLQIDLVSTDCDIESVDVVLDWPATLSQVSQRYRTAAIAWPIGWHATSAHGAPAKHVLCCFIALFIISAIAQNVGNHGLLLGNVRHQLPILLPVMAWSYGAYSAVQLLSTGIAYFHTYKQTYSHPVWLPLAVLCTSVLVPPVVLLPIVLVWMGAIVGKTQDPKLARCFKLSLLVLPLQIPSLAAWIRHVLADWTTTFPRTLSPALIGPLACISTTAKPSLRISHHSGPVAFAWGVLAIASFGLGVRHTYSLPWMAQVCMCLEAVLQ